MFSAVRSFWKYWFSKMSLDMDQQTPQTLNQVFIGFLTSASMLHFLMASALLQRNQHLPDNFCPAALTSSMFISTCATHQWLPPPTSRISISRTIYSFVSLEMNRQQRFPHHIRFPRWGCVGWAEGATGPTTSRGCPKTVGSSIFILSLFY